MTGRALAHEAANALTALSLVTERMIEACSDSMTDVVCGRVATLGGLVERLNAATAAMARRIKLLESQADVETSVRISAETERDEARREVCWLRGLEIVGQRHPGPALGRKGELEAARRRGWLYLYTED